MAGGGRAAGKYKALRSCATDNGTPKKVFAQFGLLDLSGSTRGDWPELSDTERPGEVGDCRKTLEIGSSPSSVSSGGVGKGRGEPRRFPVSFPLGQPSLMTLGREVRVR